MLRNQPVRCRRLTYLESTPSVVGKPDHSSVDDKPNRSRPFGIASLIPYRCRRLTYLESTPSVVLRYHSSVDDQKVRGRHVLKAGSTEDLGAHGLNVHGFCICRFAASRGCAAHGALRAHFGLEILLKIKPNEKYENLKFWLQTTT